MPVFLTFPCGLLVIFIFRVLSDLVLVLVVLVVLDVFMIFYVLFVMACLWFLRGFGDIVGSLGSSFYCIGIDCNFGSL